MTWMMEIFKNQNVEWSKVRVVMADKHIGEQDVVKPAFPEASVLFHALLTFRREVSCENLGITEHLHLKMDLMMNTWSCMANCLRVPLLYFADKRDEWVLHYRVFPNNRLESINSKLKLVISRHSSLEQFISNFLVILSALHLERDHKAAVMFQKVKVHRYEDGSAEKLYSLLLTKHVNKQIQLIWRKMVPFILYKLVRV